ncbi:MAG: hypothetical protein M5U09_04060 [Gammaproteobacteria bacterium]|nr:hypothetical protein [Gammaproteobacteria bacterium]
MKRRKLITPQLVAYLRHAFRLDWNGIHGAGHWARVRYNALVLAGRNGANTRVVELFAFLHDAERRNDDRDPGHGLRASRLAAELNGRLVRISDEEQALLEAACRGHSGGRSHDDLTVRTCWDADRLDLGRVGVRPDPDYLCTPKARDPALIEEAWSRSRQYW